MSGGWTRAVCKAAGWEFCEEHQRPRYRGSRPCNRLHERPEPKHHYTCLYGTESDVCTCGALRGKSDQ